MSSAPARPLLGVTVSVLYCPSIKATIRKRFRAPRTTDSSHHLPQYPDLTRTLLLEHPDQLWVSDITYITIWLPDGSYVFCYLSLVTDAYTKEIIGYCVGDTLGKLLHSGRLWKWQSDA
ncbi:hypothetical protein NXV33_10755 [Bacteroides thetaiotaomicron]|nr:hypothetical protein [Bacteroides thetaiotaomicron]